MSPGVIPMPGPDSDPWADLEIKLPPPRPRIDPGIYQARSVRLQMLEGFNRRTVELTFEVYKGELSAGVALARVPMFLRWPQKKGLSPNSKLARLFYTAGIRPSRGTHVSLDVLRYKLWLVEVGDAKKDANDSQLSTETAYSVIKNVVKRLA